MPDPFPSLYFIDLEQGFIQVSKDQFNNVFIYYIDDLGDLKLRDSFEYDEACIRDKVSFFLERVVLI